MKGLLITLTGPSCAGKSTLEQLLVDRGFARVISNTSRPPRAGEVDGVHYRFRTVDWFNRQLEACALIEHVEFAGNHYGNTEADIMDALTAGHGNAVWVIEPVGLKQVIEWHEQSPFARAVDFYRVFVDNPFTVILERFFRRMAEQGGATDAARRRMEAMITTERRWVDEAAECYIRGGKLYDVVLTRFDESNVKFIVDLLLSRRGLRSALHDILQLPPLVEPDAAAA
jgi:guanylate kinase